ncbi:RICIN domain-containing protein [Streptomyces bobili]|uniref:RICIN domain-containing protein n=1 Tax=Streptomyces bobili TaxID=67280 RepID=UPI0033AA511D
MHATRTRSAVATVLAGVLMVVASPAIAHAESPTSSDPAPPSTRAESNVIMNSKSGKVLQAVSTANGARVVQQPRVVGQGLQDWFSFLDQAYRSFENFTSGLNLGINGASTAAGAVAITATPSGDLNQDWFLDDDAYIGAYFALKNRKSGLCLGISGASTANGAAAAQFPCDGTSNQSWLLSN